jgi:hypothetical protein
VGNGLHLTAIGVSGDCRLTRLDANKKEGEPRRSARSSPSWTVASLVRPQEDLAKASPGSSGPVPGTLKVKCVSSCQVTLPTMGAPCSWVSVKIPFP